MISEKAKREIEENLILDKNVLYLNRLCGVEQAPVKTATWHIIDGDGTEDDPDMLCLDTTFGIENGLHKDAATLKAEPIWGIQFHTVEIYVSALQLVFFGTAPCANRQDLQYEREKILCSGGKYRI